VDRPRCPHTLVADLRECGGMRLSLGPLGCRYLSNHPGLCGPLVEVSVLGTTYTGSGGGEPLENTNLGNDCPSGLPCCDELRENPVFCCIEARRPEFALSVCEPSC
jgi:hypothetical protein